MDRREQIAAWLKLFVLPEQHLQVMARKINGKQAITLFFRGSQVREIVEQALRWESAGAANVWFTINPLRPEVADSKRAANKEDVIGIAWVMIDCEHATHADGQAATEQEKAASWTVLLRCRGLLEVNGFKGQVICDSGNGWHLFYPVSLGVDGQEKTKALLKGLKERCSDEAAHVDAGTHLLTQSAKIYGTITRKGEHTAERPHRYTKVVEGDEHARDHALGNTTALDRLLGIWQQQEDQRKGPKRPATTQADKDAARGLLYAREALRRETEKVATAGPGTRQTTLNASVFSVSQLAGAGFLSRAEIEAGFIDAARACGLLDDIKEFGVRDTIRRAYEAGSAQPRALPESNGHHTTNGKVEAASAAAPQVVVSEPAWEQPIPLDAPPAAMPFPLDVLPEALRQYCRESAWATNTPIDFTAVPMLTLAGGAIGNSRRIFIKESHKQSACLFSAIIGAPGSGKSIPLDFLVQPFYKQDRFHRQEFDQEMLIWEGTDKKDRGPRPTMKRCLFGNTTTEAIARVLSENPRGLVMFRDEISALFTGMNQYKDSGKGSDWQFFLEIWNHARITIDRNKFESGVPLVVHRPYMPICGTIQPDAIQMMRQQAEHAGKVINDGMFDRFLLAYPESLPAIGEEWRVISKSCISDWEAVINALFEFKMEHNEGEEWPRYCLLTPCARDVWERETKQHADEINEPEFPEWLKGVYQKFVGYSGRFALIVHLLRYVLGEVGDEQVDGESMRRAWDLSRYFKAHIKRVMCSMGADPRIAEARKVLNWLARNPSKDKFSRSDVYMNLRHSFSTPEALESPLKLLTEHRYLYRLPDPDRSRAGRKPAPKYLVSPLGRQQMQTIQGIKQEVGE